MNDMKKKIVSLILVMVMTVLALVSCGFESIVSRDLGQYIDGEFDKAAFYEALAKLEIADGDYTSDPAIREIVEREELYNAVADKFITNAEKLKEGKVGADDIFYFCYYTTYTKDGTTYYFDLAQMKDTTVTGKDTATKHVVKLGSLSEDDDNYEFQKALADAIKDIDVKDYIYSTTSGTGTAVKVTDDKPTVKVVVSYNLAYTEPKPDDGGAEDETTVTHNKIVSYEILTLDKASNDPLIKKLLDSKTTLAVGKNATFTVPDPSDSDPDKTKEETKFDITVGEGDDAIVYTYDSFKVQWIIDSDVNEMASFEFDSGVDKLVPDSIHSSGENVDLKDQKLTYHIYPVYYYDVPEINAQSYLKYALGSSITASSLDVFGDESYKNDDKTVKSIVEALVEIYAIDKDSSKLFDKDSTDALIVKLYNVESKIFDKDSTDEDIIKLYHFSNLQAITKSDLTAEESAAFDAAIAWITSNLAEDEDMEDFFEIKKEYVDAKTVYDNVINAGGTPSTEEKLKYDTALTKYRNISTEIYKVELEEVYDETLEEVIDAKIAAIVGAESADAEIKNAGEAIISEKKEDIKLSLIEKYNTHITTEVGKAVYDLIMKSVSIKSYPEDIVEEFYNHLYESYEYDYYKGSSSSGKSYYSTYGSFKEFLVSSDGANAKETHNGDYVAAITDEAKSYLAPMIKIYVVAKALESDAVAAVPGFIEADITAGLYEANYKNDDKLSDKQNAKAEKEAKESAEESKAEARENATKFLVTDKVFKEYKKSLGSSYKVYEENYGERNLRAALQFEKLCYYLLSTDVKMVDRNDTKVEEIVTNAIEVDGNTVIKVSFRNEKLNYTFKAETETENQEESN